MLPLFISVALNFTLFIINTEFLISSLIFRSRSVGLPPAKGLTKSISAITALQVLPRTDTRQSDPYEE